MRGKSRTSRWNLDLLTRKLRYNSVEEEAERGILSGWEGGLAPPDARQARLF